MSTRRGAAALLALIVLSSCGIPVEDSARPISGDDIPATIPSAAPAPTSALGDQRPASVELFFVQGSRLAPVRREVPLPLSLERAIAEIARGPTPVERNQGFRTALPKDLRLAGTVAAGVPLIEVTESFAGSKPTGLRSRRPPRLRLAGHCHGTATRSSSDRPVPRG